MLRAICLCAAWCRACEAYAPLFAAATRQLAGRWLDIEDEAALVGDLEIETFPSLLLFDERAIHFAGPLRPDAATLQRLLRVAAQQSEAGAPGLQDAPPALLALVQRLRAEPASGDPA